MNNVNILHMPQKRFMVVLLSFFFYAFERFFHVLFHVTEDSFFFPLEVVLIFFIQFVKLCFFSIFFFLIFISFYISFFFLCILFLFFF